jgi:ribose transport system ATP-binding protein
VTGPASDPPDRGDTALRVAALSKTFAGTRALVDVSLEVRSGEIHALVGGNGSGKSTLVKILAGVYRGDPGGTIAIGAGAPVDAPHWTPTRAFEHGMRFVHQNPAVFGDLTVAENLAVGNRFPTGFGGRIRWGALNAHARKLIDRYHITAAPGTPVRALNPASRTMVAVARALADRDGADSGVLVLDEPTTSLPAGEIDILLTALRRCARAGQTILYVSHRLDEVLSLADRVTVLRDGQRVATANAADLTETKLVELIAGRPLTLNQPDDAAGHLDTEAVLDVRGLRGGPLRGVDLRVGRGEIVGVAGLLGSGRTELLQSIFGARPVAAGEIRIGDRPVLFRSPADAMAAGVAYVPEDRAAEAVFASMSVRENISAGNVARYFARLRLQHGWERRDARTAMDTFLVRAASDRAPLVTLSGGNQQKVILARWLRREPAVLLLDEPTQGVDVAAREEIYGLIRRAAGAGTAVVVVANDFTELTRLCGRVVVLRAGRIAAEVTGSELDSHRLTELAYVSTGSTEVTA